MFLRLPKSEERHFTATASPKNLGKLFSRPLWWIRIWDLPVMAFEFQTADANDRNQHHISVYFSKYIKKHLTLADFLPTSPVIFVSRS